MLDHSIGEIAAELELSVAAVKAALHRGRVALRDAAHAPKSAARGRDVSAAIGRYASLFNAHDWDGVRALLADDVRLDLVAQRKAVGRRQVGQYLGNSDRAGEVTAIRDFRYVSYIAREADYDLADDACHASDALLTEEP